MRPRLLPSGKSGYAFTLGTTVPTALKRAVSVFGHLKSTERWIEARTVDNRCATIKTVRPLAIAAMFRLDDPLAFVNPAHSLRLRRGSGPAGRTGSARAIRGFPPQVGAIVDRYPVGGKHPVKNIRLYASILYVTAWPATTKASHSLLKYLDDAVWIIGGQRAMDDARARARNLDNYRSQLKHREFIGIADIYSPGDRIRRRHKFHQPIDQIVDITKGPGLRTITIDCNIVATKSLHDEI